MNNAIAGRMLRSAKRMSNRARMRRADQMITLGERAYLVLLAVLAQSGGSVTVTDDTLMQCAQNLPNLNYEIRNEKRGESIVAICEVDPQSAERGVSYAFIEPEPEAAIDPPAAEPDGTQLVRESLNGE